MEDEKRYSNNKKWCVYVCVYAYVCACICACVCACMSLCACVRAFVPHACRTRVCVCVRACVLVCLGGWMGVPVYVTRCFKPCWCWRDVDWLQTSAYDLKEAGETWRGLGQPGACYPYDPTGMPTYPYSNAYVFFLLYLRNLSWAGFEPTTCWAGVFEQHYANCRSLWEKTCTFTGVKETGFSLRVILKCSLFVDSKIKPTCKLSMSAVYDDQ